MLPPPPDPARALKLARLPPQPPTRPLPLHLPPLDLFGRERFVIFRVTDALHEYGFSFVVDRLSECLGVIPSYEFNSDTELLEEDLELVVCAAVEV